MFIKIKYFFLKVRKFRIHTQMYKQVAPILCMQLFIQHFLLIHYLRSHVLERGNKKHEFYFKIHTLNVIYVQLFCIIALNRECQFKRIKTNTNKRLNYKYPKIKRKFYYFERNVKIITIN